jgi:energy-coupling factor transporter transmembrane protein EcfT
MTPLPDWLTSESSTPFPPSRRKRGRWLEKTQRAAAEFFHADLFSEEFARKKGLLQKLGARSKIVAAASLFVLTSFLRGPLALAFVLAGILFLAMLSRIPLKDLTLRKGPIVLWTGLLPALPAMFSFVSPGESLVASLGITRPGFATALLLFLRVAASAGIGFLLILTTSWQDLLSGLRGLGLSRDIVEMLGMMGRYLALLVAGLEDRLWAKQSRTILPEKAREARGWIAAEIGMLWHHAAALGEDVFLAMKARGYSY